MIKIWSRKDQSNNTTKKDHEPALLQYLYTQDFNTSIIQKPIRTPIVTYSLQNTIYGSES